MRSLGFIKAHCQLRLHVRIGPIVPGILGTNHHERFSEQLALGKAAGPRRWSPIASVDGHKEFSEQPTAAADTACYFAPHDRAEVPAAVRADSLAFDHDSNE